MKLLDNVVLSGMGMKNTGGFHAMEEKESKVQKVKQYILKNKVLISITACLVIFILAMSGTVSSAVND